MRPLFVPLKGCEFDAFDRGAKTVEYRRFGPNYNLRTCTIGRGVTLSRGYSGARRTGVITSVDMFYARPGQGLETYGPGAIIIAIAIALAPRVQARMENPRETADSRADSSL